MTNILDQEQNFFDVNIYFELKEGQTFELPTQKVDHMWTTEEKWFHYNDYQDIKTYDKDKFLSYVLISFTVKLVHGLLIYFNASLLRS